MAKFIRNGPNVPERLLRAHEEGRVVFFCGAGISCGAGLPLFEGLVERVGGKTDNFDKDSDSDFAKGNYDVVLKTIERDIGRHKMRQHIWDRLQPEYRQENAKVFHQSLLTLSKTKVGRTHLVTTNVDRIFEDCLERTKENPYPEALVSPGPRFAKDHRWNGIVYLHGLLPEFRYSDSDSLDNLIFTTADFGRAYLGENEVARFLIEVLKKYTVCFVGYSADDLVMRYLLDATADDEDDWVKLPKRYVFTDKEHGWENREIIPILYPESAHHLLFDTFVEWARVYATGISEKKARVNNVLTIAPPDNKGNLREQHDYGQIMWALCDPDMVRYFSRLNPRPKWEWINLLSSKEFGYEDLEIFGHDVSSKKNPENYPKFSLIEPKIMFEHAQHKSIFESPLWADRFKNFELYDFCHWVSRHLDNPEVAIWLAGKGMLLGQNMKRAIRNQLEKPNRMPDYPEDKRNKNDDPVISPVMRKIWGLFLTDTIMPKHNYDDSRWFDWEGQHEVEGGLTPNLRLKLREFLQPKVSIQRPLSTSSIFGGVIKHTKSEDAKSVGEILYTDVDIDLDHGERELAVLWNKETTSLDDKQFYFMLFEDSLTDLFEFSNYVDRDSSIWFGLDNLDRKYNSGWRCIAIGLYDLLKDLSNEAPEYAKAAVFRWADSKYMYFRRMTLDIFVDTNIFMPDDIFNTLTKNDGEFLFDHRTYRNANRVLSKCAVEFSAEQKQQIQHIILSKPDED